MLRSEPEIFSNIQYAHTSCYVAPQELFGSEGVEMAVHFLRKGATNFYSGLGHNKLILSTVDCVWSVHINLTLGLTDLIHVIYETHQQMPHLHLSYTESAFCFQACNCCLHIHLRGE